MRASGISAGAVLYDDEGSARRAGNVLLEINENDGVAYRRSGWRGPIGGVPMGRDGPPIEMKMARIRRTIDPAWSGGGRRHTGAVEAAMV